MAAACKRSSMLARVMSRGLMNALLWHMPHAERLLRLKVFGETGSYGNAGPHDRRGSLSGWRRAECSDLTEILQLCMQTAHS